MKKWYLFGAVTAFALLIVSGIGQYSKSNFFHVKCDSLAAISNVQEQLNFKVPKNKSREFNDVILLYFQKNRFSFQSSQNPDYLTPPDETGKQTTFLNVKTIGCNFQTIVWSENVVNEADVLVTVHRTWLGNKKSSALVASELREQIRGVTMAPK